MPAGDPYFGWREFLTGLCELHEVSGDHVGMFSQSNAKVLADQLRDCLQKAQHHEGTAQAECRDFPQLSLPEIFGPL